ncbi:hypothetical protein DPMN_067209 [Dreissena polymorpha]|uniref:Uncharacterized protein n=1 Tax=Dreissena polymorpha TaxID=45954 RepID=A0A9D4BVN3_DREPO|nr:hypothetical protein DPMN_067209 [Dreissena polymorpha]
MSSIRLSCLSSFCTEKHLQAHFANPSYGGGQIKHIYYPLFDNDAVIIFEDRLTADCVSRHKEHVIEGEEIDVRPLTYPPVFNKLHAEMDPAAAKILQADQAIRDAVEQCDGLTLSVMNGVIVGITGNWFQLEWVWAKIERFTREQIHIPFSTDDSERLIALEKLRKLLNLSRNLKCLVQLKAIVEIIPKPLILFWTKQIMCK